MKKLLLFIALFITAITFGQSPQKMSYQAVLRNSSSALITSAPVGMKIIFLYINGLVSLEIGNNR